MPPSDSPTPTPPPVSGVTSGDPDEGGGYRVDSDGLGVIEA